MESSERRNRTEDPELRREMAELRRLMRDKGIREVPLDWDEIERQSRKRWWAENLQGLGRTVTAAVEVILDVPSKAARVVNSLGDVVKIPKAFTFTSRDSESLALTLGRRSPSPPTEDVAKVGSERVREATIIANAAEGSITVQLGEVNQPITVVLVPSDETAVRRKDIGFDLITGTAGTPQDVRFDGVPSGEYALAICTANPSSLHNLVSDSLRRLTAQASMEKWKTLLAGWEQWFEREVSLAIEPALWSPVSVGGLLGSSSHQDTVDLVLSSPANPIAIRIDNVSAVKVFIEEWSDARPPLVLFAPTIGSDARVSEAVIDPKIGSFVAVFDGIDAGDYVAVLSPPLQPGRSS